MRRGASRARLKLRIMSIIEPVHAKDDAKNLAKVALTHDYILYLCVED